jgi:hypothetical protein
MNAFIYFLLIILPVDNLDGFVFRIVNGLFVVHVHLGVDDVFWWLLVLARPLDK